jgi:MFS family permease
MPDGPSHTSFSKQEPGDASPSPAPAPIHEDTFAPPSLPLASEPIDTGTVAQILPAVFFTFICYLSVGIPLAVLPTFVHLRLGYGTVLAGLVISAQYIATFISRPRAGHLTDVLGPKRTAIYGLLACAGSGLGTFAAAFSTKSPVLCVTLLVVGRLMLGVGESLLSISGIIWGVGRAGSHNIAKVISWNGVATYTGLALGAPLGIVLEQQGGLAAVGLFVFLPAILTIALALRLTPLPLGEPKPLPFAHIFSRVAPFGTALALGGIGFGVLATFVTLFYAHQHWTGAAFAITLYGVCFIGVRITFSRFISYYGGFPVAIVSFAIEALGFTLLAFAHTRTIALLAAALIGFGFSLVFPALAVEAVRGVPVENRGTALGAYNVFIDFSLFVTGPAAGAIIAHYGYSAAFLCTAAAILLAFALTGLLASRSRAATARM